MVDQLTDDAYSTIKGVAEVSVDLIKTLAKLFQKAADWLAEGLDPKEVNERMSKEMDSLKMSLGEFSEKYDTTDITVSDKSIADAMEKQLKRNKIPYHRIGDDKFVVEAKQEHVFNALVAPVAQKVAAASVKKQKNLDTVNKTKQKLKDRVDMFKKASQAKNKNRERTKEHDRNKDQSR